MGKPMFIFMRIKKNTVLLLFIIAFVCNNANCQSVCTPSTHATIADGNWSDASTWESGIIPPTPSPGSTCIQIKHNVVLDVNQVVRGDMTILLNASLVGAGNDLKVGRGVIDKGELTNYGTLTVRKLVVKPKNGCIPSLGKPWIHNYGVITTMDDLNIGNNCGAGSFFNYLGGKVYVTDILHLDNYLCNSDSIFIGNKFKIHGGNVDCCGYIETSLLDIDPNGARPSTLNCQHFCQQDGITPTTINIAGTVYADLNDAILNSSSADVSIDADSTTVCDPTILPIELLRFEANVLNDKSVQLGWETANELNNDFFTVEKSIDGSNWQVVGYEDGAGTSNIVNSYSKVDYSPFSGTSYYRLKQTDFNGESENFPIISVTLPLNETSVAIYPNPAQQIVTVRGDKEEIHNLQLFNIIAQDVTDLVRIAVDNNEYAVIDISRLSSGFYIIATRTNILKFRKE